MKPAGKIRAPQWVERVLKLFLDEELLESVLGDIEEKFEHRARHGSLKRAEVLYVLEGLGLIRLSNHKKKHSLIINPIDMWKNYILIALRNLKREKIYSVLNVFGLAVGIASVLLIYRYVQFESSYDKFHTNHQKIYRITEEVEHDAQRVKSAMSHSPVAEILSENLAGVKNVIRIYPQSAFISSDPQKKYREDLFCFADSMFFQTFSFEVLEGSLDQALKNPFSVVVTEAMAIKYFGNTNIVGKELLFEDETKPYAYTVTAVVKNVPQNSHFDFNFLASFSTLEKFMPWYNNWHHPPMYVYIETESEVPFDLLKSNVTSLVNRFQPDYVKEERRSYVPQSITDIHLHSNLEFEWQINSNYKYLKLFVLLAGFILLIASINFVNMVTAQAVKRTKEIGVRKTFGGNKTQLVWQFMSETFVYVLFGFITAILLAELSLQFLFNDILQKNLSLLFFYKGYHAWLGLSFVIFVSVLAGLYPSLYLSRLGPAQIVRSHPRGPGSKGDIRKGLVTFQLIISSLLISATIVISSQINYFKTKDLGFAKAHIITLGLTDRFAQKNYTTLKDQLLSESTVSSVGLSSALPGRGIFHVFEVKPEGAQTEKEINIKTLGVDEDFLKTYNIRVVKGRDFSKDIMTDQTDAFILNKAAALKFGWSDPVGKDFELAVYIGGRIDRKGKVIGLIEDFNFQSLHNPVEPLVLYINKHPYYAEYLSVRMQPGNLAESVGVLQKNWKSFHPDKPLEYIFLNDNLGQLYKSETKMSSFFTILTLVAIVISCLGLFALSSYTASKRAKEMGIRKVFGASTGNVVAIQFKEYTFMIFLANIIVIPVCWYWADHWLGSFAYHVSFSPYIFIYTLSGSLALAIIAVSFHSIRLAHQNPIHVMRHE